MVVVIGGFETRRDHQQLGTFTISSTSMSAATGAIDEIIDLTGDTTASGSEDDEEEEQNDLEQGSFDEDEQTTPTLDQLNAAISSAPVARLQLILIRLAKKNPAVRKALTKELLTISGPPTAPVRVIPRWEICENCGNSYDVNVAEDNEDCVFHPGDLEVEDDKFVDWDEDCHGPMDTRSNRREFPENFTWSCCEGDGTAGGCVNGRHRPKSNKRQRF
ncbi:hypothetical protein MIND_00215600 [Mycena indigotica]|uniref:C2H2-type domain-containing protein n=1 Tax=Mycena indigotica TaxID=2126181 RepID=A0A8H6T4P3_9AGAR|nr:uncharacterized protein MIND_00215600 [Mycena indigotica]KAF7312035.1 hypothetical protein MIND_00215600 [Mycena indigotica]